MGIADGSVNFGSFGAAEVFNSELDSRSGIDVFFRNDGMAADPGNLHENLSVEERAIADKILVVAINYIQELGDGRHLLTSMLVKKIIKRLLEKLEESSLPETAVGVIAGGVWVELNRASGLARGGIENDFNGTASGAEQKIVQDILKRMDGKFFIIKGLWKDVVQAVGPQASSKIIRVVAQEIWPEMRRKLRL